MIVTIVTWVIILFTWGMLFNLWRIQRRCLRYKDASIASLERTNDILLKAFARLSGNAKVAVSEFDRTRLTIEVDAATWAFVDRVAVLDLVPTTHPNQQEGQAR